MTITQTGTQAGLPDDICVPDLQRLPELCIAQSDKELSSVVRLDIYINVIDLKCEHFPARVVLHSYLVVGILQLLSSGRGCGCLPALARSLTGLIKAARGVSSRALR